MNEDTPQAVQSDAPVTTDTAPAPADEANVQVQEETPEAAVAQEATVNATDTVEEGKLYAGKYKTVEDLEKSYGELQSKFTSTASEKAELSKILAEAFSSEPEPVSQAPVSYEDDLEPVNKPDDSINRDVSVLKFVMSNPDADGAAMNEVLKNDPFVSQISGYEAKLRYAHAVSQNTAKPKVVAEAQAQARAETQVKFAEKQAAQVESASTQAPPTIEEPLTQNELRQKLRDDKGFGEILQGREGLKGFISK